MKVDFSDKAQQVNRICDDDNSVNDTISAVATLLSTLPPPLPRGRRLRVRTGGEVQGSLSLTVRLHMAGGGGERSEVRATARGGWFSERSDNKSLGFGSAE